MTTIFRELSDHPSNIKYKNDPFVAFERVAPLIDKTVLMRMYSERTFVTPKYVGSCFELTLDSRPLRSALSD